MSRLWDVYNHGRREFIAPALVLTLAFAGPVGDPLTASRFESSCDYGHFEAAKYCMWGHTMPHSNFQHVFCHQRFYILIEKEHRIKTSDSMSMEEREMFKGMSRYELRAYILNSHMK